MTSVTFIREGIPHVVSDYQGLVKFLGSQTKTALVDLVEKEYLKDCVKIRQKKEDLLREIVNAFGKRYPFLQSEETIRSRLNKQTAKDDALYQKRIKSVDQAVKTAIGYYALSGTLSCEQKSEGEKKTYALPRKLFDIWYRFFCVLYEMDNPMVMKTLDTNKLINGPQKEDFEKMIKIAIATKSGIGRIDDFFQDILKGYILEKDSFSLFNTDGNVNIDDIEIVYTD